MLTHASVPLCSQQMIEEIDRYFVSIKPWFSFSPEDYQKWKLIKKAAPKIFEGLKEARTPDKDELWAAVALRAVEESGYSVDIWGAMNCANME